MIGEAVSFSATASGGTTPYSYSWTWGDSTPTGTGQSPSHTFATQGTFTVTLRVTDSATPSHTLPVPKSIAVTPVLAADFTFTPTPPTAGDVVSFLGIATGGSAPYTFLWTFGDGDTGSGATVTHVFVLSGTYAVTLTVSDSAGHVATKPKFVNVSGPLAADFSFSTARPMVGEAVNFSATAAGGTPPYSYSWTFGDGGSGTVRDVSHTYASVGTFNVTLRVTDSAAHVRIISKSVTVTPRLAADFTSSPTDPVVVEDVNFTATATGGTAPYTYEWTFGDASSGSGSPVTHDYATEGRFSVKLTVSDSAGHAVTVTKNVTVNPALGANLTVSQLRPVTGEPVAFSATASGGSPPYTFRWDFGDGSPAATGATVTHAYTAIGTWNVTVTTTDASGRRGVARTSLEVTPPLVGGFTVTPPSPVVGQRVSFNGTITSGSPPYTFAWSFGDGGTGQGEDVGHPYAVQGTFNVTMTASDSAGHRVVVVQSVRVFPILVATLSLSPLNPTIWESITFSATALGGSPPWKYNWTFGDSETGVGARVSHSYVSVGTFNVTLNVTDSQGRVATVLGVVSTTPALVADFTFGPGVPMPGRPIAFSPSVSGGTPPYTYNWTFGDESTSQKAEPTHRYDSSSFSASYRVVLAACDSAGHCTSASKDVTLVDWQQVVNIAGAGVVVAIVALWFVRRFLWRTRG